MKLFASLLCFVLFSGGAWAQAGPVNYGTASHPFIVSKIEQTDRHSIVYLVLTNQIDGGYFCADKNIYLIDPLSKHDSYMLRSEGIPTCPDLHRFNKAGETLAFSLVFDKIETAATYVNIVEACQDNCFSIRGVILDTAINEKINESYRMFDQNELAKAIALTEEAINAQPDYPYGFLHFNLVHFNALKGDFEAAKRALRMLKIKDIVDKRNTLSRLQAMKYYPNLM